MQSNILYDTLYSVTTQQENEYKWKGGEAEKKRIYRYMSHTAVSSILQNNSTIPNSTVANYFRFTIRCGVAAKSNSIDSNGKQILNTSNR